jgi:predicted small lipoprotein YifL
MAQIPGEEAWMTLMSEEKPSSAMLSPLPSDLLWCRRFKGVLVNRRFEPTLVRFAAVGMLVTALGLAGCGRKAGLDAPPSAAAVPTEAPAGSPSAGTEPSRNILGTDHEERPVAAATSQRKNFFLDWLLD